MSRVRGRKQYISLVQGLNTEASPLDAPEGSTSDELNMILDTDGMVRRRRRGLEPISNPVEIFAGSDVSLNGSFFWSAERLAIVVLESRRINEQEDVLRRFNIVFLDSSTFVQRFQYVFEVPCDALPSCPEARRILPAFAEIRDGICLTFGGEPLFFNMGENAPNLWHLDLRIRDFKLVQDGLRISERPTTLSDEHQYNLLNAGWYELVYDDQGTKVNPISKFFSQFNVYPSNADIPALGYRIDDQTGDEYWDPEHLDKQYIGSSEAPRGHYVYKSVTLNRRSKKISPQDDGTKGPFAVQVLEDGDDPVTGTPPPSGEPVFPTPDPCPPGEVCFIEP